MKNASAISVTQAKKDKKTACPTCIGKATTTTTTTNTGAAKGGTTAAGNTTTAAYYATKNGKYYHSSASCSGMRDAVKITLAQAQWNNQPACPVCIKKTATTVTYYATSSGRYYHVKSNCTGMAGAVKVTAAAAQKHGQTPCPTCMRGKAGTTTVSGTQYYSTRNGKFYHKTATCGGMQNADKVTLAVAKQRNQVACPSCLGSTAAYYARRDGKYFHKSPNCSGMQNASRVSVVKAQANGQTACPVCLGGKTASSNTNSNTNSNSNNNNDNGTRMYYGTPNGRYYHKNGTCTNMKNAVKITRQQAINRGQTPCPRCLPDLIPKPTKRPDGTTPTQKPESNKQVKVWVTIEGSKYHSKQYCSGMKHAAQTNLEWALDRNYTRCTVCDAPRPVN